MNTWQQHRRQLFLASASPRRRELLYQMGFSFEVVRGADLDEAAYLNAGTISESLSRLAAAKADTVAREHTKALVLSADTVVVCNGVILGKPSDEQSAVEMLQMLSGRAHQVMTGVALTCSEVSFCRSTVTCTDVFFRDISDDEIGQYIATGEPFDKAGAYGIQGKAMIFVDKIVGCFYNVVGLPVKGTIDLFKEFDAKGIP